MSNNKKYLEENYDGETKGSLLAQVSTDLAESIVIAQEAEKKQEEAKENETKRILGQKSVTEQEIDKIMKDYATNEGYRQYLVEGAMLQCDQASVEPFELPDGTKIDLVLNQNEDGEERILTSLHVLDQSMSINDAVYATVLDTEQGKCIFPFPCHCKKGVDREEELNKIKNDPTCKTKGVCKHLMKLNREWENLPLEGQIYKKRDVTLKITDDLDLIMKDTQCINRMSMLFCKHGGLITPVTSGQPFDALDTILCKNLSELTDEDLRLLGHLFQIGDENIRMTIFDYLYLPPLMLDEESYSESWLTSNIWWLNNKKLPEVAEKYLAAINELKINNQGYDVKTLISLLSWNQDKIDETYKKCMQYSIESGILISPKLALSIIIAEGTGSYDTNSEVARSSVYDGNGPQPNFELDTELGLGIIRDKLSGFIVYKDDYLAKWPNEKESHLLQYLCDETPKLGKNMAGVYATARDGWISVVNEKYQFYNKETEDDKRDYVKDYETILEGYDKDLIENSDTVQYEFEYDGSKVVANVVVKE